MLLLFRSLSPRLFAAILTSSHVAAYLLLFILMVGLPVAAQPLSGSYVIDSGGSGDYTTFQDAFDALTSEGITGPATFTIADGIYNEEATLGPIPGASSTNAVTFRSQSGDVTDVTLVGGYVSSSVRGPLALDGASHTRFERITVEVTNNGFGTGVAVLVASASTNVQFTGNRFRTSASTPQAGLTNVAQVYAPVTDLVLEDNSFENTTLTLAGTSSQRSSNTIIRNNIFENSVSPGFRTAAALQYQDGVQVTGNTVSGFGEGIDLADATGSIRVVANQIDVTGLGLRILNSNATSGAPGLVANNAVRTEGGNASGSLIVFQSAHQQVYHNSVDAGAGSFGTAQALLVNGGTGTRIANNILFTAGDAALEVKSASGLTLDHNVLFTSGSGSPPLVVYENTDYATLADYQNATGQGTGAVFADPQYASDFTPGSPLVADAGTDLTGVVPNDLNGTARTLLVSAGAVEVDGAGGMPPLAGTYVIDVSGSGDYASFQAAFDALTSPGINGPVTFEVVAGVYAEQVELANIVGATATNTVTFRGQSGDSTDVTLRAPYDPAAQAGPLVLDDIRHARFERITFELTTIPSSDAAAVRVADNTLIEDVRFTGNRFLVTDANAGTPSTPVARGLSAPATVDLHVVGNRFVNTTLWLIGSSSVAATGTIVRNNVLRQQANPDNGTAINLSNHDAPVVTGNDLHGFQGGLSLSRGAASAQVLSNTINVNGLGLSIADCNSPSSNPGLAANNTIISANDSGLNIFECVNQHVFHNSVSIAPSDSLRSIGNALIVGGFTNSGSTGTRIANNIFASTEDGAAIRVNAPTGLTLEYNALYANGRQDGIVQYDGVFYPSLEDYQNATGQGIGSVNVEPAFVSDMDLHLAAPSITDAALQGIALPAVSTDIDGESRSPTKPTMGADEVSTLVATQTGGPGVTLDVGPSYAVDIVFSASTTGSGPVSVRRFSNGLQSPNIPEEEVVSYRWCIDAGSGLTVGSGTEVRFALNEIPGGTGIIDPEGVIVYKRDTCGAGTFQDVTTRYDSSTNEIVAAVSGFSEFVFAGSSAALPVELVSFEARHDSNDAVHLSWSTASETSNAGFRIERRSGAALSWTQVSMVPSQAEGGTSDAPLQYTLVDTDISFGVSTLTYRIVQHDLDGSTTVAGEQVIELEGPTAFALEAPFPNPTRGATTLRYALPQAEPVRITLYDGLGRRLRTLVNQEQEGRHELPIATTGLASGTYFVRITAGPFVQTKRLVVVR